MLMTADDHKYQFMITELLIVNTAYDTDSFANSFAGRKKRTRDTYL